MITATEEITKPSPRAVKLHKEATELLDAEKSYRALRPVPEVVEWSHEEQEPNLDIHIRTRRTLDARGNPCSQIQFAILVEGDSEAVPSQIQRDYAAMILRHAARVHQDAEMAALPLNENLVHIATMLTAELRATMNMLVQITTRLVRTEGLDWTASKLRMKAYRVRHLLKSRGQMPIEALPAGDLNDQQNG